MAEYWYLEAISHSVEVGTEAKFLILALSLSPSR
jgi:hypothetical protein